MRTRDPVPAARIDAVLVMIRPLGAVHALSRGWQGKRTLCMRPVPEVGASARFEGVTFETLRAAGWRTCPACVQLRGLPRGRRPTDLERLEPSAESWE